MITHPTNPRLYRDPRLPGEWRVKPKLSNALPIIQMTRDAPSVKMWVPIIEPPEAESLRLEMQIITGHMARAKKEKRMEDYTALKSSLRPMQDRRNAIMKEANRKG